MKDQFWTNHQHGSNMLFGSAALACPYSDVNSPLPPMAPAYTYNKYNAFYQSPDVDHTAITELKKIVSELRHIGKQLDTMLHSSQLSGDDYTHMKKEQKILSSLYNSAHAYISRSTSSMHDNNFVDKVLIGGLEKSELDNMKAPLATQEEDFVITGEDDTGIGDSAEKKQQQLEALNANIMKNRLTKVRKSLYAMVKHASKLRR